MAARVLKIGAIVISVTRPFSNLEPWELLERQERQMSWAPALVYVYRKLLTIHPEVETPSTSTVAESMVAPELASNTGITVPDSIVPLELSSNTEPTVKPKTCDRGS